MNRERAMKLAQAVLDACDDHWNRHGDCDDMNLAAIVDAHVAQARCVEAEIDEAMSQNAWRSALRGLCVGRELATPDECAENVRHQLRTAKKAAQQPAPVNQQMLAALNRLADASRPVATALYNIGQSHEDWSSLRPLIAELDNALSHGYIAAAEAAQAGRPEPVRIDLYDVFKAVLRESYAGKSTYFNDEQIDAGCSEKAKEYADIADRLGLTLYTAPPAVAVPPEKFAPVDQHWMANAEYIAGWNDCRAAMLAAAPKPEGN